MSYGADSETEVVTALESWLCEVFILVSVLNISLFVSTFLCSSYSYLSSLLLRLFSSRVLKSFTFMIVCFTSSFLNIILFRLLPHILYYQLSYISALFLSFSPFSLVSPCLFPLFSVSTLWLPLHIPRVGFLLSGCPMRHTWLRRKSNELQSDLIVCCLSFAILLEIVNACLQNTLYNTELKWVRMQERMWRELMTCREFLLVYYDVHETLKRGLSQSEIVSWFRSHDELVLTHTDTCI